MWLNDANKKLEGSILRDKLKLDVESVQCAVDSRGWLIVRVKTQAKHRSSEILKILIGEEAFKAMKQPAAMHIPTFDYNQCAPSDGHKIRGTNGIEIFANSKDTKSDFKLYSDMISNIMNGSMAGKYLGEWKHTDRPPTQDHAQSQWVIDEAVQRQVMREDPGAFASGLGDVETDNEDEVMVNKRSVPSNFQGQQQTKRACLHGFHEISAFSFAGNCMDMQRKDAVKNADLRMKLAELTNAAVVKDLTEKLRKSEDRELEMERRLQKSEQRRLKIKARLQELEERQVEMETRLVESEQRRIEVEKQLQDFKSVNENCRVSEKETQDLLSKVQETLEQAEGLVVSLTAASEGIVSERVNHADTKERTCIALDDFVQNLEDIKKDFTGTTHELVQAKKDLASDLEIRKYLQEELRRCEYVLREYNGPGWRNLKSQVDLLDLENHTLRAVIRNRGLGM